MTSHLLKDLNPAQREAVQHTEGPLLLLAGAGSGKTRVITYRIAYLIQEIGINPWDFLAITFTNKAASEMKERLQKLIGEYPGQLWVSTFHSSCVRILRRHIDRLGFKNNFVIYDTSDKNVVIKDCLKELDLDPKKNSPKAIGGTISNAKNKLQDPREFRKHIFDYYHEIVSQVYSIYQEKMRQNNALDFDDLIMLTVELFKNNEDILNFYQDKFKYILIDEYQDTNHAQYTLVNLLAAKHRNICVVGDPDQGIYGWRGADIQNILDFEHDYPDARVIKLEQNYRSTKNILKAANKVIEQNTDRKKKELWTDKEEGELIKTYFGDNEHSEARYVVEEIVRLKEREKYGYKDVAVLYRTHAQSRVLEEEFLKANVPYEVLGGTKFYDRKEIKDILAYLRLLSNPDDDVSLSRIINVPKRSIGERTVERLQEYAAENLISAYVALDQVENISTLGSRARSSLQKFKSLMDSFKERMNDLTVTDLTSIVMEETGYLQSLKEENTPEARARIENLQEFISVTMEYDRKNPEGNLTEFLAEISLITDIDQHQEDADKVLLMTLHTAKGLEFPVVFLCGMEEMIFPHANSMNDENELQEERRLCYVGMTRAMERLYMTYAWQRTIYGDTRHNPPSRFLDEIPEDLMEKVGVSTISNNIAKPEAKETKGGNDFLVGDSVLHPKWGEGVVVQVKGEQVSVAFPDMGIKHLMVEYAPLKKI